MEEYDADINFHILKFDNGTMEISSDIDDQLDYLELEERAGIIIKMIGDLYKQLYENLDENSPDDSTNIAYNMGTDLRDTIISAIINFWHNQFAQKTKQFDVCDLEFSMVLYKHLIHKKNKQDFNYIINTTHSDNINLLEPINAGFAFVQDVIQCMLEDGFDKRVTKGIVLNIVSEHIKTMTKYIEDWKSEEDE